MRIRRRKRASRPWDAEPAEETRVLTLRPLKAQREEAAETQARMLREAAAMPFDDAFSFEITYGFLPPAPSPRQRGEVWTLAVLEAEQGRWKGLRGAATMKYQAKKAIGILREIGCKSPRAVTADHLFRLCSISLARGCAHSTVGSRLSCLSAIGVEIPDDFHFKVPKPPKWFLRPEDEARVPEVPTLHPVALNFIQWTVATGLRVEETLRVQAKHVSAAMVRIDGQPKAVRILNVAGTKTVGAQASIVLGDEAVSVLGQTGWPNLDQEAYLFPIAYKDLRLEWLKVRAFLGFNGTPTATLKALRRSFAMRATLRGMPTDVLRQYLRHANIMTTQGYLNLIGGYSHEAQAKFMVG